MIETTAETIALILMCAGGVLLVAAVLALACLLAGFFGQLLFNRMRRIYQLATIWYYLDQMAKRGTHAFPKPTKDNL